MAPPDDDTTLDTARMRRALALARRALGDTSPNPMVGAVLVRDGRVIGEGWHRGAGTPHAEAGTRIDPPLGASNPVSIFNVVDLPAPFGPRNPKNVPRDTSRSSRSTAQKSPKYRVNCSV